VELAERLQTSPTPVREALRLLGQEGLVEVSARRYSRVAAPQAEVAGEAYELLGTLESLVLISAPPDAAAIADAEAANAAMAETESVVDRRRADIRFHRALSARAKPLTREMLLTLYGRIALLEVSYHQLHAPDESVVEHAAVIDALKAGDGERAGEGIVKHWQRGYAAVLEDARAAAAATEDN
jgi:DNA-binding GntR family transcriptional regulator